MREIDLNAERDFENRKASGENVRENQSKYYWATEIPVNKHLMRTFLEIQSKDILEIGCASGIEAMSYCSHAKTYIGVDISDVAIDNCNALKIQNAQFYCVDGHKLPLDSNSVECVIVNSLLHHLNLKLAFDEISRVLSPNGTLIFREPLGINPAFQLYRALTPNARTTDERPFTFSDLRLMSEYFELRRNVYYFGFLSVLSAYFKSSLIRLLLTKLDNLLGQTHIKYCFWQFSGIVKMKSAKS